MTGPNDSEHPVWDAGRHVQLAERFVELADTLVDDYDVVDLMESLIATCVDLLEAPAAALLIPDPRGRLQVVASSSEETLLLELLQLQNDEGPCLECVRTSQPVNVSEISSERARWPRFVEAAESRGFTSVHAIPMRLRSETIGSLNLFRVKPPPLSDYEQRIAQALADVATIGILQHRSIERSTQLADQLQAALDSRVVIEQAKGVLAEYAQVDMGTAFAALRSHSRNHNRKLADVSADVVSGSLDPSSLISTPPPSQP